MRKICDHEAYLTDMKRCKYSETTQYVYYGQTPLKKLCFDNPLARNNKIGWHNRCRETLIASVGSTSKLALNIHNLGEKNAQTNSKLSIGPPRL